MGPPNDKDLYEAKVRIEGKIIFKTTGKDLDQLKVLLSEHCDIEHSGTEGELIDLATGKIIYRCHKQTIIDK